MDTETLLAISGGATFLLAIAAFWAIWQTYRIRKEDKELSVKIRDIEKIISWANMTREAYLASMDEYVKYVRDEKYHLKAEKTNLETQARNLEAQKATTDRQELRDLKRELRELQKEQADLQNKDVSELDYLFPKLFSIFSQAAAEFEALMPIAEGFGKDFKGLFDQTEEMLAKMVECLESRKDFAHELVKYENLRLINFFCSNADAIRSLLIRHGSKLKL